MPPSALARCDARVCVAGGILRASPTSSAVRRFSPPPVLGALIGFALFALDGLDTYAPWLGAGLGFLLADRLVLRDQVERLTAFAERWTADQPREAGRASEESMRLQDNAITDSSNEVSSAPPSLAPPAPRAAPQPPTPAERARRAMRRERVPLASPAPGASSPPPARWQDEVPDPLVRAWTWASGGNWVARIGIVVLFVGLALLVGLAVEAGLFPIELRLMAAALMGGALVGAGWYWRARGSFGVTLQGGGVGVLYLVVYAALQLYGLLPAALAFGLMATIAALAAALAIVQNQPALAVLGALGGFGAPIAASTGSGDPVLLFGYYAVLNVGIAAVALWRTWRGLILLGFACTFVVGAVWGGLAYRPALYAEIQPFLAFFFLLYLTLTVLIAGRKTERPGGVQRRPYGRVEGTLAFGLPVAAFALQVALVADVPNGRAWSAAVLGAVYLLGWLGLRRWKPERFGPLGEAFLAVGLVFATATIPLAKAAVWVGALWGLEAAGLAWFGVRYGRRWMRAGALLLAVGAALALAWAVVEGEGWRIGRYGLGGWTVAIGLLAAAGITRGVPMDGWERAVRQVAFGLGVLWWIGAALVLVDDLAREHTAPALALLLFAGSALLGGALGRRLAWSGLADAAFVLVPLSTLVLLAQADAAGHPFAHVGWLAWPLALGCLLLLLAYTRDVAQPAAQTAGHVGWVGLAVAVAAWELAHTADRLLAGPGWSGAMPGLVFAAALGLVLYPPAPALRAFRRYAATGGDAYRLVAWALGLALLVWTGATAQQNDGGAAPLPYLPLLNPLDLAYAAAFVVLFRALDRLDAPTRRAGRWLVGTAAVLALAAVVARAVHHLAGVAFSYDPMWESGLFQTSLAIAWAVAAFGLMATASRSGRRGRWFGGAALLGLVIAKLFVVDLEAASAVAQVVSFIAVGLLALGIGYASPLPPASEASGAQEASEPPELEQTDEGGGIEGEVAEGENRRP